MLRVGHIDEVAGHLANDCDSFGAVLEDFEVRDAIAKIIANKTGYDDMMHMDNEWHSPPNPDAFN